MQLPVARTRVIGPQTRSRSIGLKGRAARRWHTGLACLCALRLACASGPAATDPLLQASERVARSASGQFVVYGNPEPAGSGAPVSELGETHLPLSPPLVVVACERIKQALANTLRDRTPWKDKILVVAHPARSADEPVTLIAERFRGGWQYRLEMPDPVERTRFARALVHALLRERAGRRAREHPPDVPAWLAEGLSEHLLQSRGLELLPPAPRWRVGTLTLTPVLRDERWRDPLEAASRRLQEQPPLSLEALSWPDPGALDGPEAAVYRANAQVFVTELLRLPEGTAALNAMLDQLAGCYNWQTAFFSAFAPRFRRPLDLEKWWALQLAHYTGRDPARVWTLPVSWLKLEEALQVPVEIRRRHDELPAVANVSLSSVIRDWDYFRQELALRERLRALELLRLRLAPELVGLLDAYRHTLTLYLERRARLGRDAPGVNRSSLDIRLLVRDTLRQLDELEARRAALRASAVTATATNSPPSGEIIP